MTQPTVCVILNRCVTVSGTRSLSGIFFCVITTQQSFPRMARLVFFALLMALNAYSANLKKEVKRERERERSREKEVQT